MRKYISLIITTLFLLLVLPQVITTSVEDSTSYKTIYATTINEFDDWVFGSNTGPDLWHVTTVDAYEGDAALGCFNPSFQRYENNMDFNYALAPVVSIENAIDMVMEYYCKYITEDSDDYWSVCLYDPATDSFFTYYTFDGYSPTWHKQSFNIKSAYDYWYQAGYFRYGNGSRSYELQVGMVFTESDATGTTNATAEIHGVYWSGIYIDEVSIKQLTFNSPPETPNAPFGESVGMIGEILTFSAGTTDPNGDTIRYGWDWDGDENVDEWTEYYSSGKPASIDHSFTQPGTYTIKVKAEDIKGSASEFSPAMTLIISSQPNTPSLTGPSSGKAGDSVTYTALATDPDNDQLFYLFDWGDGFDSGWIGPFESGEEVTKSHVWQEQGTYVISVKARDEYGIESNVASLEVTMPKTKFYFKLLEEHYGLLLTYLSSFFS